MNEFIKESFELEKKKALAKQIAILCLEINFISDERKRKQAKPCVFFSLSGHVGIIDIDVYEKGWESKCRADRMFCLNEYSTLLEFTDCLTYLNELYLSQTIESEIDKNGDEEGKELSVDIDRSVGV